MLRHALSTATAFTALNALLAGTAGAAPTAAPVGQRIGIPAGVVIKMHVLSPVSSSSANPGDSVPIQAVADVVVDGYVIVKAGADGLATVATVDRAASGGHSGTVTLDYVYVRAVDGEKIRLAASQAEASSHQSQVAIHDAQANANTDTAIATAQTAASAVGATAALGALGPLGSIAGFALHARKGRDETIASNQPLPAYVADAVHVTSTERDSGQPTASATDDGFAR